MSVAAPSSAFLQLLWLASPALPVGGFSYSEGLEAAVDHGQVRDEASAAQWLSAQLGLSLARGDLALVAQAHSAWLAADVARLQRLNDWVLQTRESLEFRLQTEQMGRSLLAWLRNHDTATPAQLQHCTELGGTPSYPVVMALALAASGAPAQDGLLAYAFGWAENMVQAAIKSVPLGQSAGQRVLSRLAAEIPAAVAQAISLSDVERQVFSPMLAILSARHETQYSRLFRS
ncbi:urease accessory protein UreF [Paucibacter sp. KCTC 42545]|uniref:urease accessory protein UreF n=1 Tax=Paucibacter sp. KCTC 42545 TaxID=1768242 RepID=UPI000733BEB7|nr:urease accessory UreF family protein [Paucibacter sp. KCTC 42545]ALT79217.1 urease accessory protein UreF [Paucibacter sp. KCTC 42545]